jgi:hypothetical protein
LDDSVDNEATPSANKEEAKPINGAVDEEPAVNYQVGEEDVVDQAGIIGDLEQEDVHKTKWVKYITHKEKLIHDGFSMHCKATKHSLAVGVQVHERSQLLGSFYNAIYCLLKTMQKSGSKRSGVIIDKIAAQSWIVRCDKKGDEGVDAQARSCDIKVDEYVYDWIAIDYSVPVSEPQDYANVGLVDFDFELLNSF